MKDALRIALYHRIDTCHPSPEDLSAMENHLRHLRLLAEQQGHEVTGVFRDFASGNALDHPGLTEMLNILEVGLADGVLVKDISHLGRDLEVTAQIQARIASAGAYLFTRDAVAGF